MRTWITQITRVAALAFGVLGLVGCQGDDDTTAALLGPEQAPAGQIGGEFAPRPLMRHLARSLELNPTQRTQIGDVLARERDAMIASGVFDRGPEAVRSALRERHERVAAEIAAFLTSEQRVRFEALKERLHERMAGGFGRGEMLARELGLSDEQKEQVVRLVERKREVRREVHSRIRGGDMSRAERRAQFRAERDALHAEIATLLTPEQRARFEALVSKSRMRRSH